MADSPPPSALGGPPILEVRVRYPEWVTELDWAGEWASDEARMALAVEVSRRNVAAGTGGPFGAAIFEERSGRLVSVGMNMVVPSKNSTLHAEMVAFQMAEARLATHTLGGPELPAFALYASCEPCAMCLGATLWSGVHRLVSGATGEDARAIGFDEGPVFPESWRYLEARGVRTVRQVGREEARRVLEAYAGSGGPIYNGGAPAPAR